MKLTPRRHKSKRNRGPNPIDVHVGLQLRRRRTLLGISQHHLGEMVGVAFQQIQKYEKGTNRVGCSRLFDFSRVLDVPIGYFFDGISPEVAASSPRHAKAKPKALKAPEFDPAIKRESLELMRAYHRISDPKVRQKVRDFVKALGAQFGGS